ncbi:Uncharacterised protein [Mycobacteroides abscessus subsp. abscessus]|nr:Uncharacterised protein [Mycobacteroides abscessus subsp. abscessus]
MDPTISTGTGVPCSSTGSEADFQNTPSPPVTSSCRSCGTLEGLIHRFCAWAPTPA